MYTKQFGVTEFLDLSSLASYSLSRIQALIVACFSKDLLDGEKSSSWMFSSHLPSDAAVKEQI